MSPLAALAQVNPWIVSPQTTQRSGDRAFPERPYRYDQTTNGYANTPIWGSVEPARARRRNPMTEHRQAAPPVQLNYPPREIYARQGYGRPQYTQRSPRSQRSQNSSYQERQPYDGRQQANERRPLYGPFANERWTGLAPSQQLQTGATSSIQRQGRFVPSYATGQFGTRQSRRAGPFQHYPPPGYNPSARQARAYPYGQLQMPPAQQQARSWPYRASAAPATNAVQYSGATWQRGRSQQLTPTWQRGRSQQLTPTWQQGRSQQLTPTWQQGRSQQLTPTWQQGRSQQLTPTWQQGRSQQLTPTWQQGRSRQLTPTWASPPPWAVNPAQNGSSPGFAGPSTFGNPFGSPFGGLSGPFGTSSALALPPGGMW